MAEIVMLDSGPLGKLAHPKPRVETVEWLDRLTDAGYTVVLPEVADFEVRRGLLAAGLIRSRKRLDELKAELVYQPITTSVMLRAAELWAEARRRGRPTADPRTRSTVT